ncbi:MAG: universal stress protein [Clostridium sp.]|nr:universal stress protein [Clostridium sp.]MCI7444221.1 universal stress protein [Clostridium sp.]
MKRKVLVPIDGTERSKRSLEFIKSIFPSDKVELIIMNVKELVFINGMIIADELTAAKEMGDRILNEALKEVPGYKAETYFTFGYPGDEIVKKAKEDDIDIIVMTKSTRKGLTRMIGSVTINVVKHAKCSVMIVPE